MRWIPLCAWAVITSGTALAQSGGSFAISRSSVDGGAAFSGGGVYTLSGSIGQPDAGAHSGGLFQLDGGFWAAGPTFGDQIFADDFE
jgi:hypothetical protein